MSDISEIKVRIDRARRDRFDDHCESLAVSRNSRLIELIDADLDGKIADERVRPKPPKEMSVAEQVRADNIRLREHLDLLFGKNRAATEKYLSPLKSVASVALTERRFGAIDDALAKLNLQLADASKEVSAGVKASSNDHAYLRKALKVERPDFVHDIRTQTGFALGIATLFLAVALMPGSWAPSRSFAKLAMGESDTVRAGAKLAGEGRPVGEQAIISSAYLSRDVAFAESYKACVQAADQSKKRTSCVLSMPGLK
jgi:hypothetical protein